ncbi:hypothetical protein WN943_006105 [Citrus x changshan-huyou]
MHLFTDDINSAGYQHHQKTSMRGKASTRRKDVRGKEREEIVVVPMRERKDGAYRKEGKQFYLQSTSTTTLNITKYGEVYIKMARHNDIDGIKDTTRDGANH